MRHTLVRLASPTMAVTRSQRVVPDMRAAAGRATAWGVPPPRQTAAEARLTRATKSRSPAGVGVPHRDLPPPQGHRPTRDSLVEIPPQGDAVDVRVRVDRDIG